MQRSACHDPHVPVQFVYRGPAAWRCAGPPFAQERAARIREIQIARRIVCMSGASARSASGRSSLQVSVSGPTAGCRRDGVARARRAVGSRVPIRVTYARGRNGRDACTWTRGGSWADSGCDGRARRLAGGTAAYRLSLIPAIERKNSTLSHIAPRGEPLSFLRRSV